jgi:uncharacterized repeat protein (TIGR03803 family)
MCQRFFLIFLFVVTAIGVNAQTLTTLANFDGNSGAQPIGSPAQGLDGNLYGTTQTGGSGQGIVFRLTREGLLTSIFTFCAAHWCLDGSIPIAGLLLAPNGTFYGTTQLGGTSRGTVFRISAQGNQAVLYNFCSQMNCTDGANPDAALVQGATGAFYGTTANGGANDKGTVFKITPGGSLTTLYSFCAQTNCIDGSVPQGTLVQGGDGNFYGTTTAGGTHGLHFQGGSAFKISPQGRFANLYSFCSRTNCADGGGPMGNLVLASDGNFYGITSGGGTGQGCPAKNCGTLFRMTPAGKVTTLYDFCSQTGCSDGSSPSDVIQATDGNLYGTTFGGGANAAGTLFKITLGGSMTTFYSFCSQTACGDGASGQGVVQHTDGKLYGATEFGGTSNSGTVFSVDIGLPPFVSALPYTARVGSVIKLFGQGLTGVTAVSFNGTAATFSIQSDTYLTATVPAGASSGFVTVTASGSTLTSNHQFQLIP